MNPDIARLESEIEELRRQLRELQVVNTMSPDLARSIGLSVIATSAKTAASETQAVNEGGVATYNVAKAPDGFISIAGYNIPYYT